MADPKGFLTHRDRELPPRRPVAVRIMDWKEVSEGRPAGLVERQAGRCMDCGIPFCHNGCPLGNLIPDWNTMVWHRDWADASERLHATNNFPEFTGRLCPAPCETACVLGINQPPVTIKQVELSIAEMAFYDRHVHPLPPDRLTGRTVAVVGSGPAGLAAAQQLTRAGHTVAVYERADKIGGLLRYGIPEFKMEKSVLDRRLNQMQHEGTRFRTSVHIGAEGHLSWSELEQRYDAVVLAMGATRSRDLPVPGRGLVGIMQAMDYLPPANRAALGLSPTHPLTGAPLVSAEGKDVVIIGGGDTGADCLGTAHRQRARSVTQLEILPQPGEDRPGNQPWPTYPMIMRVTSAHEEGGDRVYATSTAEFLGDESGNVSALRISEVAMENGAVSAVEGTEREIPAQLVTLAMGFLGPETDTLVTDLGLGLDERSNIARDDEYATARKGIFVAGDAGRGQSLIVWAIAEGRACAAAVDAFLLGGPKTLPSPIRSSERQLLA